MPRENQKRPEVDSDEAVIASHEEPISISKPEEFSLESFRSTKVSGLAGVETLQAGLPHHKISDAKDFVRLHPDEAAYWSDELCFLSVPIEGSKKDTLHLINEDLALRYLPPALIQRFRLALATKPYNHFFLCHVPSQRLDNSWNESSLASCIQAKALWSLVASLADHYQSEYAKHPDAFPDPDWPTQSLTQLIGVSFTNCLIQRPDHPGLLRRIGARQSLS